MNFNLKAIFYSCLLFISRHCACLFFFLFRNGKVAVQDLREVKYISKGIYFYNRQLDDEKFIMKEI